MDNLTEVIETSRLLDLQLENPPPRAARFIKHRLLRDTPASASANFAPSQQAESLDEHSSSWTSITDDIPEALAPREEYPSSKRSRTSWPHTSTASINELSSSTQSGSEQIPLRILTHCSVNVGTDAKTMWTLDSGSSGSTPAPHSSRSGVPAATVFARNAPSLHLPALDNYISNLPAPKFKPFPVETNSSSRSKGKGKAPSQPIFPPLGRLAAAKKTIEDLETNVEVSPGWRNRNTIFGTLVDLFISVTGSSAIATYYSLEGLVDTVQIFALILGTFVPHTGNLASSWRELFLGTIPNVLALNLAQSFELSIVFLVLFMLLAGLLLYYFHVATGFTRNGDTVEGLQPPQAGHGWGLILVSFVLTVLYLPLSTIALHALVWSDDFWVVPNPYINATSSPPTVAPLGPANEYRPPLDFCYTTTMKTTEINFAPLIVMMAVFVLIFMTVWYPFRLRQVIKASVPSTDPYTELGKRRNAQELDREYQRMLARDTSCISFIYADFRRGWGTYKSTYMFAKLSALVVVAVIDPYTCVFRSVPQATVAVIRQCLLLAVMLVFLLVQCIIAPFLNPTNNASEVTSRINYVLTAAIGLGVALQVPGQAILDGPVLYAVYAATYSLSTYFTVVNWTFVSNSIKVATRRIDFSIDIFSPRLDISSTSPHLKRRIWQESLSILFFTSPETKIPDTQRMIYAQARNDDYPPYLLNFQGTPGERYAENLKILREVGSLSFRRAAALTSGPDRDRLEYLQNLIQQYFTGPDSYWEDQVQEDGKTTRVNHWGNSWWIPFPPTLVVRYDDGPVAVLCKIELLELYVIQNSSAHIRRKKEVRLALRALDGQIVNWPYQHAALVGAAERWWGGQNFKAETTRQFYRCVLSIKRRGNLLWKGLQLGSGFELELTYAKDVKVGAGIIGVTDDFEMTSILARFFSLNYVQINSRLPPLLSVLDDYRDTTLRQIREKRSALSYSFLSTVYERPNAPLTIMELVQKQEHDLRVRDLIVGSDIAIDAAYERLTVAGSSPLATFWYIFWDDVWRKNSRTISFLRSYSSDFDPRFPTSLAYHPLPRPALESFLRQRGLMSTNPKWSDWFYSGLLNKLYFRMNDIAFRRTEQAIFVHLGSRSSEADLEDVDLVTQGQASTLGTGPGDEHEDSTRPRPAFLWEGLLSDPLTKGSSHRRWLAKLPAWLGITPIWQSSSPSSGVSLDVKLEDGKYVLAHTSHERPSAKTTDTLLS